MIIDAQIHPVHPTTEWSESFAPEQALEASIELAVAAMSAVGVDAAMVNWDLATVQAYVDRYPDRFCGLPGGGPMVPIETTVDEYVAGLKASPGIQGLRLAFAHPLDDSRIEIFRRGEYEPYLEACERHGLPVFVLMHGFLPELHATLKAHPDLPVILDHLGLHTPPVRPAGEHLFEEVPDVVDLAQFPNVAVKFTGAPSLSLEPYPFADVWARLRPMIDAFGVDRLMWGSDFTRCASLHSYRESVDFLLHTDEMSASDKEALLSGTFRRWLGWPGGERGPG
jgi:L-fuconolactonase